MLTASAFLLLFSAGCLLALFRHPIYGLSTYIALVYIHPPTQWWSQIIPSLRWSLIAAAVTLLGVLFRKGKSDGLKLFDFGLMWGLVIFVIWVGIQSFWALDSDLHSELFAIVVKYTLLLILIYKCIDSIRHLRIFLWTHAAGCFYLGTVVINEYLGGRFEGFRGPGINEANAAALLIVTGVLTTFILFLSGSRLEKVAAFFAMPITLNALVATISRSGFLALVVAGSIFNLFVPKSVRKSVRVYSVLGLILLVLITNPLYWQRIGTILFAGAEVEGVDTGSRRLILIEKQFEMFVDYPLGCGHRCTAVLSPAYLSDQFLTGEPGRRARSSHNTFMSLLVEQGIVGGTLYVLLLLWLARTVFRWRAKMREADGIVPILHVASIACLGAITVGDLFVGLPKIRS